MAADNGLRTFGNGIVAVELEITSGTWYTLWAPNWLVKGERWQGFLGDDDDLFVFDSPAKLLAFLEDGGRNELAEHPKWAQFKSDLVTNVVPTRTGKISLVEVPRKLAQRPGYESTSAVARGFDLLRSMGNVLGLKSVNNWFHSYSILDNVRRGPDHYQSQNGLEEWSGVGRTVLDRWKGMLDDVEVHLTEPEVDEAKVEDAQKRIDEAQEAREKRLKEKEAEAAAAANSKEGEDVDPYDKTIWADAGIDPIRISLGGQYVYTLRCYVGDKPRFLGRHGEINTFPNSRALVRWLIDAHDHDLEELETWGDIVSAANAGELEVTVHDSNQYSFAGLHDDIAESIDAVDTDQLGRAYELLADAADWAGDDSVNKVLLSYPKLQNYLAYMLGSPSDSQPSAPFDEEAKGWKALEEDLTKRFTRF